jgi:hypothetical protein
MTFFGGRLSEHGVWLPAIAAPHCPSGIEQTNLMDPELESIDRDILAGAGGTFISLDEAKSGLVIAALGIRADRGFHPVEIDVAIARINRFLSSGGLVDGAGQIFHLPMLGDRVWDMTRHFLHHALRELLFVCRTGKARGATHLLSR